jgi:hypothetical protein
LANRFSSPNLHRAEMVKDILANEQIQAMVVNLKDSAYQLGRLEVRVSPDSVMKAIKIIKEDIKFDNE